MTGIMPLPPALLAGGYPIKRLHQTSMLSSFQPSAKVGWYETIFPSGIWRRLSIRPEGSVVSTNMGKGCASTTCSTGFVSFVSPPLTLPCTPLGTWSFGMTANDTSNLSGGDVFFYGSLYFSVGQTNANRGSLFTGQFFPPYFTWGDAKGYVYTGLSLNTVNAQVGDCLVFEVGVYFGNNSNQKGANVYYGGTDPNPLVNGDQNLSHHPWLQFNSASFAGLQF